MLSRRSVAAVAALALTTLGTLSGAAAAPTTTRAAHTAQSAGIPPITGGSDTAAFVDGTATVRKARVTITLPRVLLRAYANEIFRQAHNILYSKSPAWAVTHLGRHPRFGVFPVAHSAVLGFGAIPITADLHLSQVVRNGTILPIVVASKNQTIPPFRIYPAVVSGQVDVRVSNVFVDRVPLRVGPNCHSARPMRLRLVGISPAYNLFTGGLLRGTVTIPPFTGCGTGGDDLDPLLTGMISGPGNELVQRQGNLSPWNTSQPNDCGGCRPAKH